jgi:hypothetical protein
LCGLDVHDIGRPDSGGGHTMHYDHIQAREQSRGRPPTFVMTTDGAYLPDSMLTAVDGKAKLSP